MTRVTPTPPFSLNVADTCPPIDTSLIEQLFGYKVRLFGAMIAPNFGDEIPSPGKWAKDVMGMLNSALMPLIPLFDVLDILILLMDLVKGIPLLDAGILEKILAKIKKLLACLPPVAMLVAIKDSIMVLIILLLGIRSQIAAIVEHEARLLDAELRAATLPDTARRQLLAVLDCAKGLRDVQMLTIRGNAAPINRLVTLLNMFGSMAGLPEIPSLSVGAGGAMSLLAPLDQMITILKTLHSAIPG